MRIKIIAPLAWIGRLALLLYAASLLPAQIQTVGKEWPLYFSTQGNSTIYRMDQSGNQSVFSSGGLIQEAYGIAFDARGNLFVSSVNNNSIVKLSSAGQQSLFASDGLLAGPRGLAFDKAGNLYVACFNSNRVVKIDPSGNQSYFGTGSTTQFPQALAFDGAGNLWVGTAEVGYLSKIDPTGTQEVRTGASGGDGMAFVNGSDFWTTTATGEGLGKFRVDGTLLGYYLSSGITVLTPSGIAQDFAGNLWVIDRGLPYPYNPPHVGKVKLPCPDVSCVYAFFDLDPVYQTVAPPQSMAFARPVTYLSSGFAWPVVNAPAENLGTAGRTYPLKWTISYADGALVTALSAISSVNYKAVACNSAGTLSSTLLTATSSGASGLRFDGSQFVYNWQTPSVPGCYQLWVTFNTQQTLIGLFNLR